MNKISKEQFLKGSITDVELQDALDHLYLYDEPELKAIFDLIRERQIPLEKKYYYRNDNGTYGPFDEIEFFQQGKDGVLDPDTYIWRKGDKDWKKAKKVFQFEIQNEQKGLEPPIFRSKKTKIKNVILAVIIVFSILIFWITVIMPQISHQREINTEAAAEEAAAEFNKILQSASTTKNPSPSMTLKATIEPTTKTYTVGVTRENFELLEKGMSVSEVTSILGNGTLNVESASSKSYSYENPSNGVTIRIIFVDDKLSTKAIFD